MRIACLSGNATNTHSEYVILVAFPRQQWLYERASVLRHTYGTLSVFIKLSLNLRLQNLFYCTLHKALALTPRGIQSAFFKRMDGQKMYNGTQFIISSHYLNKIVLYILILVTHIIIVFLIFTGCYGFSFYNTYEFLDTS